MSLKAVAEALNDGPTRSLAERIQVGLRTNGATIAVVAAITLIPVALLTIFGQHLLIRDASFTVDLAAAAIALPIASILATVFFSAAFPGMTSIARAFLLGAAAMLPYGVAGALVLDEGWRHWTPLHTFVAVFYALVIGGIAGVRLSASYRRKSDSYTGANQPAI